MILVVGATGHVGGQVARRLLDRRRPVRVLVREGSAYEALVSAGAEPAVGDLKDPSSLAAACAGAEAVVTTANSAGRGGDDNPETVDLQGNRNLIEAARDADVGRFVFTSALVPDVWQSHPFMAAKLATEEYLRTSSLEYTVVRPAMFMDVWVALPVLMGLEAAGAALVAGEGRRRHSFIAAADVAQFLAVAVDHPAAPNAFVELGGPEALSWLEVVQRCEAVLGQPVPVRSLSAGDEVAGLPPDFIGMLLDTDQFDSVVDMTDTARIFNLALTRVEDFIRAAVAERA